MQKYFKLANLGWLILILVSAALINSALGKVLMSEEMVKNFEFMKLSDYLVAVGVFELLAVGLILYPRTSTFGAVLVTSLMSAATVIHLSLMGGHDAIVPVLIGILSWVGHCLRRFY